MKPFKPYEAMCSEEPGEARWFGQKGFTFKHSTAGYNSYLKMLGDIYLE